MHFNVFKIKSVESLEWNSTPTYIHTVHYIEYMDVEEVGTAEYVEMIQSCTDGKFNQATTSWLA